MIGLLKKTKALTETANPEEFTNDKKRQDWVPPYKNVSHIIPGRNI